MGVAGLTPIQVGSMRIFAAFLCFIPFFVKSLKAVPTRQYGAVVLSGLTGNLIPAFLFALAQTHVESSVAGMLNSLTPVFVLIVSAIVFRKTLRKFDMLGVLLGLAGCSLLVLFGGDRIELNINSYAFFIIVATICYGISSNILKYKLQGLKAIHISSLALLSVGPLAGLVFWWSGGVEAVMNSQEALHAFYATCLLGVMSSAIALVLFNVLIQKSPLPFAASVTYLIPVVALFWGLLDGEVLHLLQVAAMLVILVGIFMIKR